VSLEFLQQSEWETVEVFDVHDTGAELLRCECDSLFDSRIERKIEQAGTAQVPAFDPEPSFLRIGDGDRAEIVLVPKAVEQLDL
jgi:hypothetical protein